MCSINWPIIGGFRKVIGKLFKLRSKEKGAPSRVRPEAHFLFVILKILSKSRRAGDCMLIMSKPKTTKDDTLVVKLALTAPVRTCLGH